MAKEKKTCYSETMISDFIADMLFEITKDKKYIYQQYRDEWTFPNKYKIVDPRVKAFEERIKELETELKFKR